MDYQEVQKISVAWIRWLFIISSVFTLTIVLTVSVTEEETSTSELYFSILLITAIMGLSYALVFLTKLTTEVRETGMHYTYRPFVWKTKMVRFDDIASWKMFVIKDALSYGGYGYRTKLRPKTTGFIMGSKDAVEFTLHNGRKIVFTTTNPYMLHSALRKHISSKEIV